MFDYCFFVRLHRLLGGSIEGGAIEHLLFQTATGKLKFFVLTDGAFDAVVSAHEEVDEAAEDFTARNQPVFGELLAGVYADMCFLCVEEAVEDLNGEEEAAIGAQDVRVYFPLGDLHPREDLHDGEAQDFDVLLDVVLEVVGEVEVELFAVFVNKVGVEARLVQVVLAVGFVGKALDLTLVDGGALENCHAVEEREASHVVCEVHEAAERLCCGVVSLDTVSEVRCLHASHELCLFVGISRDINLCRHSVPPI